VRPLLALHGDQGLIPYYSKGPFNTLDIPIFVTLLSVVLLAIHGTIYLWKSREESSETRRARDFRQHIQSVGGPTIYAYMVVRSLSCVALFGLSIVTVCSKRSQTQLPGLEARAFGLSETATYVSLSIHV